MDAATEILIRRLRETEAIGRLIGEAPAFLQALAQLPAMARSTATVLISGETGTGKELVARAIHYLSDRAAFPFVPVNCGSLPDTLMEDELFGHERGAFTDARLRRPGLITQAERGTLLLDEVDLLTPRAQVALLRVLQDKSFRLLGSSHAQQADVRFLAATNAPLGLLVRAGTFRVDLYYRLCVFSIDLPPLRDRQEDILPLAAHFLAKHNPGDRAALQLSPAAAAALVAYPWPGNVRELENAIIRATHVCQTASVEPADLGLPVDGAPPLVEALPAFAPTTGTFQVQKRHSVDAFERDFLIRLLTEYRGNVSHAAHAAGKDRRELGKLIKKHQLAPKAFAAPPVRHPPSG